MRQYENDLDSRKAVVATLQTLGEKDLNRGCPSRKNDPGRITPTYRGASPAAKGPG